MGDYVNVERSAELSWLISASDCRTAPQTGLYEAADAHCAQGRCVIGTKLCVRCGAVMDVAVLGSGKQVMWNSVRMAVQTVKMA